MDCDKNTKYRELRDIITIHSSYTLYLHLHFGGGVV